MGSVIAILGAGTGLGVSLARRFGREGYDVALVGRRAERLEAIAAELAGEGIRATPFPADLATPAVIPGLISHIEETLGLIDVLVYGPISGHQGFTPAKDVTTSDLQELIPLLLMSPVAAVRAVLPNMVARGSGTVLLTQGSFAAHPLPYLSGPAPVMAAARNYFHSLNGEVLESGVFAGVLSIGASIAGSEMAELAQAAAPELSESQGGVDPADLADVAWQMHSNQAPLESVIFGPPAPAAESTTTATE
ncbi:hypothetical protein AC792_09810 [Arthrobacter sp. RIT-PI-e]|nr:hypothetical protein AC792_09810 [Arthrobacter sp. RIT-PI-e]